MTGGDAVVEVILIKITQWIYIEIPFNPPLQKGEENNPNSSKERL
jgi:hypothetical protein